MFGWRFLGSTASARSNTRSTASDTSTPSLRGVGRRFSSIAVPMAAWKSFDMIWRPAAASTIVSAMPQMSVHGPVAPKRLGSHCSGAA